MKLVVDNWLGN